MPCNSLESLTYEQLAKLWPQVSGELEAFVDHLSKNNAGLTGDQLRLAIQMADRYFRLSGTITRSVTMTPSYEHLSGSSDGGANYQAISVGQLKAALAMMQKFYEIFSAIVGVVGPLLQPPEPDPAPAPLPPGGPSGSFQLKSTPMKDQGV